MATLALFPLASATSHSSRSHGHAGSLFALCSFAFSVHQSPEERHGPADHKTFPCSSPRRAGFVMAAKTTGRPSASLTCSCHGGRNMRKAIRAGSVKSDIVGGTSASVLLLPRNDLSESRPAGEYPADARFPPAV